MQKLDPKKLFSIFNASDESIYIEHNLQEVMENPFVLMGMVVRGLENFAIIDGMYTMKYKEDYEPYRAPVQEQFYNRLYGYLVRIDFTKFENIYVITEAYDKAGVFKALSHLLSYYVEKEMYERCAIIKKIEDTLRETGCQTNNNTSLDEFLKEIGVHREDLRQSDRCL